MVSKRLGQKMVENLLVIKENGELVEEYKENCGRVFDLNDDAFKEVVIEADTDVLVIPPNSAVFEDSGEEMDSYEIMSSDDEFEVVFETTA